MGQSTALNGDVAPVHKILVAGSAATRGWRDLYLGEDGGYIMGKEFSAELRKAFAKILARRGASDLLPVYLENGFYNFYVQKQQQTLHASPPSTQPEVRRSIATMSGNSRQASP